MNDRSDILDWSAQAALTDARAALAAAGVLPTPRDWRHFLDRLLLWSGALALALATVFFVAYNWTDLATQARFALVQVPMLLAVLGYARWGVDKPTGKASLLVAAILLGALLALFGQTYQTGADSWELFAQWAVLMAPWVLIGRFAGLWMLWLVVANTAIALYLQVFPSLAGMLFGTDRQLWVLFAFNTLALLAWECAARHLAWMRSRWAPRVLALAGGLAITLLALHQILDGSSVGLAPLAAYAVWLAAIYLAYRARLRDLFVLSGACLSVIVLLAVFLSSRLMSAAGLLLTAATVVAVAAACGWWLKRVAQEEHR